MMRLGKRPLKESSPILGREQGFALVTVIGVVIVATILTAAVASSLLRSGQRSGDRAERVSVQSSLGAATDAYVRSLAIGAVSERTKFAMTQAAAEKVVPSGSTVIRDTDPSVAPQYRFASSSGAAAGDGVHERVGVPVTSVTVNDFVSSMDPVANQRFVVRTPVNTSESVFWQILRVDIPTSLVEGGGIAAYVRAWRGSNDGQIASREKVQRVEVTAGFFSDYQMLVNSSLYFGTGSTINGAVHSNGTSRTPGVVTGGLSVKGEPSVTCTSDATVTTGVGGISLPAGCSPVSNTGTFIDFGRVSSSFERIKADCGVSTSDGVYCYPAVPGAGSYTVTLSSGTISVSGGASASITSNTGDVRVLLFEDDVRVSGAATGRVTIAARHPEGTMNRSANITITGDLTAPNSTPRRDVIGLISEGHVIVDLPTPDNINASAFASTCLGTHVVPGPSASSPQTARSGSITRKIDAAIIAATGGLRIPTEWTTYSVPFLPPYCSSVSITGSISAHYAPILEWIWNDHNRSGFQTRTYTWEPTMRENPPPYFPLSRTWEVRTMKDANLDCLRGGSRELDWSCR